MSLFVVCFLSPKESQKAKPHRSRLVIIYASFYFVYSNFYVFWRGTGFWVGSLYHFHFCLPKAFSLSFVFFFFSLLLWLSCTTKDWKFRDKVQSRSPHIHPPPQVKNPESIYPGLQNSDILISGRPKLWTLDSDPPKFCPDRHYWFDTSVVLHDYFSMGQVVSGSVVPLVHQFVNVQLHQPLLDVRYVFVVDRSSFSQVVAILLSTSFGRTPVLSPPSLSWFGLLLHRCICCLLHSIIQPFLRVALQVDNSIEAKGGRRLFLLQPHS